MKNKNKQTQKEQKEAKSKFVLVFSVEREFMRWLIGFSDVMFVNKMLAKQKQKTKFFELK